MGSPEPGDAEHWIAFDDLMSVHDHELHAAEISAKGSMGRSRHGAPRRCLIGRAQPPCKSIAGFPGAISSWSVIARLPLPFLTLLAPSKRFYSDKTRASRCQLVRLPAAKAQRPRPATDQGETSEKAVRRHQGPQSLVKATVSVSGAAEPIVLPKSPPAPPCGITPACRQCQSAGFSSEIPKVSSIHRPSSRPTSTLDPATFSPGSSVAGRSR
jgi:hypothetical protein